MFTRTIAKVLFLLLVSTIWLSCEDYDDSPWGYDDDLYTRASVVGTYQAESRTFQKGCALMKNNSGYTGTGYMDYGGKLSLVEWNNVNVPSAGDYTLMFRYANGSSDDRRCSLTVNDTSTGSVSFSPTGSWTKWKTVSFKARLKAGANKVRVTAISYGGPNLDKMDVVNDESDDNGTSRCVGVAENKKAFLTCPAGEVIEGIEFASYGVPEGSCTTGFTRGTCHATSSLSKVKASCLSKRYCTVTANNSTFGDPCGGTFKKLAIEYTCTQGDTTGVVAKDFVGYFERTPVMNDWHKVNISLENNQLWWKNAAGRRWSLNYAGGILETGSDCPYGVKVIEVEKQSGSDPVKALKFLGGRYNKKTIDNPGDQCPDDPNKTEPGECGCGVPEGSCDQCTNVLLAHENLVAGEHLCSENGKYAFGLSPQGELAIREGTKKLWSAGTFGSTVHLVMQGDGNLVVYNAIKPLWDSKTAKKPGATLKLENDGRVVIRLGGAVLWSKGGTNENGVVDASTLNGKIMAGYQGWFYARNDGGYNKWNHWCNNKKDKPRPDNVLFDMWPDLREFSSSELYPTGFTYADGRNAGLYSAHNKSTVERHVKWMKDYGIDGVFVQRFMAAIHDGHRPYRDKVLLNVKAGAEKYGRVFANMWDINSLENKDSGWHDAGLVDKIKKDWMHLVDNVRITSSSRYLRHNGKPLIAIWGVSKMTVMDARYADDLVDWFRKDAAPKYRASVMLGVTNEVGNSNVDWRSKSSSWQNVFRKVDVISPWTVGRFKSESGANSFYEKHVKPDKQKCDEYGVDYFPVVFPGFSACQKHDKRCNDCPRNGGKFLWRQFYNVMRAGSNMVYVAMFDEVDEGTAIYKIAENQQQTPKQWPSNHSHHEFIVMDADGYNLPSDWYLQLTGEASKMLRNEIGLTATIPITP